MVCATLTAILLACTGDPVGPAAGLLVPEGGGPRDLHRGVVSLVVEPAAIELAPGTTQRFEAVGRNATGARISVSVLWEATGGTIAANGRYTAGSDPGEYRVTALGEGFLATAVVRILAVETLPPAPPDSTAEAPPDSTTESPTDPTTESPPDSTTPSPSDPPSEPTTESPPTPTPEPPPEPAPEPPAVDGVPIRPGQSIQAAVDANPAGTRFVLLTGTHRRQSVEPKNGMTFVGEPGAVLDGEGLDGFAFGHYGPGSSNVTIEGLEIRNYATPLDRGAIQGDNTTGWTIRSSEIHHNGGIGIRAGNGMQIRENRLHDNGDAAINDHYKTDLLVEGNDVYGNGAAGIQSGPQATAAGMKFFGTRSLIVRNNRVHHNAGNGIWTDTSCDQVMIEGNQVYDNTQFGIFHEISFRAVIRNNIVLRNGLGTPRNAGWPNQAGIAVQTSSEVEVYGNTVQGNGDGIALMESGYGPTRLDRVVVRDNEIAGGRTGVVQSTGDTSVFTRDLRFERNRYGDGVSFLWLGQILGLSGWRKVFPTDG